MGRIFLCRKKGASIFVFAKKKKPFSVRFFFPVFSVFFILWWVGNASFYLASETQMKKLFGKVKHARTISYPKHLKIFGIKKQTYE